MRKSGLLLAAAVVLASDIFVLVGVARNRAGTPVETIQLTQRELPTGFRQKEDTGISLLIRWNAGLPTGNEFSWMGEEKLKSLGFDTAAVLRDPKRQSLPRTAFVVLEYDGPSWAQWLEESRRARFFNDAQVDSQSRLFVIDAATSAGPLLQKYPDRQKYLVVRGIVRAYINATQRGSSIIQGSLSNIEPDTIHVPLPLANAFPASAYTVTVAYGHRFEPWIVAGP